MPSKSKKAIKAAKHKDSKRQDDKVLPLSAIPTATLTKIVEDQKRAAGPVASNPVPLSVKLLGREYDLSGYGPAYPYVPTWRRYQYNGHSGNLHKVHSHKSRHNCRSKTLLPPDDRRVPVTGLPRLHKLAGDEAGEQWILEGYLRQCALWQWTSAQDYQAIMSVLLFTYAPIYMDYALRVLSKLQDRRNNWLLAARNLNAKESSAVTMSFPVPENEDIKAIYPNADRNYEFGHIVKTRKGTFKVIGRIVQPGRMVKPVNPPVALVREIQASINSQKQASKERAFDRRVKAILHCPLHVPRILRVLRVLNPCVEVSR